MTARVFSYATWLALLSVVIGIALMLGATAHDVSMFLIGVGIGTLIRVVVNEIRRPRARKAVRK